MKLVSVNDTSQRRACPSVRVSVCVSVLFILTYRVTECCLAATGRRAAFAGTQSQMALHAERSAARATLANQSGAANPHFLPSPPKHTHINTHKLHTLFFPVTAAST